jgi:hypothetical protein
MSAGILIMLVLIGLAVVTVVGMLLIARGPGGKASPEPGAKDGEEQPD